MAGDAKARAKMGDKSKQVAVLKYVSDAVARSVIEL